MRRLTLIALLSAGLAPAQVITTVAGTDRTPISGVAALNAALGHTRGVAVDAAGNIYIAADTDSIVARVSPNGVFTIVAGNGRAGFSGDGGPATSAQLFNPYSVAVDPDGNLFIADASNHRIRKVSNGVITTVAGTGESGYSGDGGVATNAKLASPSGVAVDANGNLYIADYFNSRVRKVSGGIITTFAGSASAGFSGDGGPATSASLALPSSLTLDAAGNLFIADSFNNRIRKVSGGVISTVAGTDKAGFSGDSGPAASASLSFPSGISVAANGDLYIADMQNARVRKISGSTITTVAGSGGLTFDALGDGGPATAASILPTDVAVDAAGNLYIADAGNSRIRKVSNGIISTVVGSGGVSGDGGPATSALLLRPHAVAVDSAGQLYIADTNNSLVRLVSRGIITTIAGNRNARDSRDGIPATSAFLPFPYSLALDPAGNIYVSDTSAARVRKISGGIITTVAGNGNPDFSGDGGPATGAGIGAAYGLAADSSSLYLAGNLNRVRKVSGGTITTVAGTGDADYSGDVGPATKAALNQPQGLALDSAGNLYIADTANHRIRKLSGGTITTVAGNGTAGFSGDNGPATNASLRGPEGVAVDSAGVLYIADTGNHRIRRVAGGVITTFAGNGSQGPAGDGGLAISASLNSPGGVAVDGAGNVFIADTLNHRIREVLANKPSFQAAPASLNFSAQAAGPAPAGQTIALSSPVPGLAFSASGNATWLGVTPSGGTLPTTLQVTVDPSSLAAGTYQGNITITVPNASPQTTAIAVRFTAQPATSAALSVDTQSLGFAATSGGGSLNQVLRVSNTGGGQLAFTTSIATSTGGNWLSIAPSSDTATAASPATLTISANPGSLPSGTYSGAVTISGAGKSIVIPATLSVSDPSATILLSQSALTFTAVAQGGVPLPGSFGILNTGQGSMSWTASSNTLSGGNWLEVAPSNGTVERPYLDASLVTVSIDPSTLSAGTYYGRIQISAPAANTPQVLTVVLTVLPSGTTLPAQVFPAGLIFTGVAGVSPQSQEVQVGNPAGTLTSFVSGIIGEGLDYLPKNASLLPNQPTAVRVFPDFRDLKPGTIQKATITLQFSDTSPPQTISILTVVAPAGTTPNNRTARIGEPRPEASGCASQGLFVVWRTPQPSQSTFAATVGQATTLDAQVSDTCGNLVGPGGQSATVQASFSTRESVQLIHIGNGTWQGTWKPLSAGTPTVQVTAFAANESGKVVGGQSPTLSAVVSTPSPSAATPTVTADGIVHAASSVGGLPISPGGLITIYGKNLADSTGQSNGPPLPQQLSGTQVFLGNLTLPILFANQEQLNVQVPYGVPVNTPYQLTVQRGKTYSAPQSLVVAAAQPGIFTVNQSGSGQGSIVKSDGVTLAQPGTPASIGETIVIYCTGLGAVTPKVAEGVAPPSVAPLSTTVNPVTVRIGGKPAQVSFAGLTPGIPGLYQINAVVPSGVDPGDSVPVVIAVAGQTSPITPPVTMAVR